jgi:hypothetical protein
MFFEIEFPLTSFKGFSIFLNIVVFYLLLGRGAEPPRSLPLLPR